MNTAQKPLLLAAYWDGGTDAEDRSSIIGSPLETHETTLAMYKVLKVGDIQGVFNFDAKNRRSAYTPVVIGKWLVPKAR